MSLREAVEKFIIVGTERKLEIEEAIKAANDAISKVASLADETGIPMQLSVPYDGWFIPGNFPLQTHEGDYYYVFNAECLIDDLLDEISAADDFEFDDDESMDKAEKLIYMLIEQVVDIIGNKVIRWEQSTC